MPNSQVPEVRRLGDGSIALKVQVDGFTDKNPVEIYGYVTQDTGAYAGAYASFRVAGQLPERNGKDVAEVKVTLAPGQLELDGTEPVTVVTWVSEVWPSTLNVDESATGKSTIWKIDDTAAGSYRYKSTNMLSRW